MDVSGVFAYGYETTEVRFKKKIKKNDVSIILCSILDELYSIELKLPVCSVRSKLV